MKQKLNIKNNKHLGIIIAAVMVIFIFLIIFMQGRKAYNTIDDVLVTESSDTEQMKEELNQISDYLEQLDSTVITNQESLDTIAGYRDEVTNQFFAMEEGLTEVKSLLSAYVNKYQSDNKDIVTNLTNILMEVDVIRNDILNSQKEIEEILNDSDNANTSRFESVSNSIAEIKSKLALSYESLISMLDILRLDMDGKHKELISILITAEKRMSELFTEEMAYLTQLICEDNQELQLKIDKDVDMLSDRMESLHQQIGVAQDDLINLLTEMELSSNKMQEEINAAFVCLQESLEKINLEFNDAHAEIKELLITVQEMEQANHEALLVLLEDMESGMNEASTSNLNAILTSMSELQENYNLSITELKSEMNQSFQTLDSNVNNQLAITKEDINNQLYRLNEMVTNQLYSLDKTINNQYNSLTNIVNTGDDGLREYIAGVLNSINQKIDSVFQLVSNGKRLLASALLTKGVTIDEDATFPEIRDAILRIPQELVIGVEKLPGTVTYDYHYHVDGSGNFPHTNTLVYEGGCYSVPQYHVHTGSNKIGDDCYSVAITHSHSSSCYSEGNHSSSCPSHTEYHDYNCIYHDYNGDGKGCDGFTVYDCGGHRYLSCKLGSGIIGYSLGCDMNETTIVGYITGCGLSDEQIIGAHIIYG